MLAAIEKLWTNILLGGEAGSKRFVCPCSRSLLTNVLLTQRKLRQSLHVGSYRTQMYEHVDYGFRG